MSLASVVSRWRAIRRGLTGTGDASSILVTAEVPEQRLLDRQQRSLLLILPHLAGTLAGWSLKVPADQHANRRWGALLLHAVAALLVLVVLGVITTWLLIAIAIGWCVVGGLSVGETGGKK